MYRRQCRRMEETSVRELVETMRKMQRKGFQGHLKGRMGRVRPIYEDY